MFGNWTNVWVNIEILANVSSVWDIIEICTSEDPSENMVCFSRNIFISPHWSLLRRSFLQLFISLDFLKAETYFPVVTCHFAFSSNCFPSKHLWRNIYSIVTSQQNRSSSLKPLAVVNANVSLEKKDLNMSRRRGTPSLRKPGALCLCLYIKYPG